MFSKDFLSKLRNLNSFYKFRCTISSRHILPKLVNVNDGGELSLVIVNCDQFILAEDDQIEADGLEHAVVVVFALRSLQVVRDGDGASVFAGLDVKEKHLL
jgi:hypothetical protein